MKDPAKLFKVFWTAADANGKIHEGELTPRPSGTTYAEIETELFPIIKDFKIARFRTIWPDGSGHISCYEKRGDIWLKTYSDNIMDRNFGYFFFGTIIGIPAIFIAICFILHFLGKI